MQLDLLSACEDGDVDKVVELLSKVADFDFSQVNFTFQCYSLVICC